jgi:integrase
MFFRWAYRRQLVNRNPMDALDCPKSKPRRNILTPDEMRATIKAADGWMLAAVLLGGFAGLRTAEILRMNWGDIDTKAGEIHVRPGVMKDSGGFDQRIVNFTEPLTRRRRLLEKLACEFHRGKLIPVSDRVFHKERVALIRGMEWEKWPENALRHSFATYHLGKSKNPGVTAFQMGHTSPAMVQRVYAVPAARSDWKAWWAI